MPTDDTSALYNEVKAWIAKQEAYEAATKEPAPLTNAQRKALDVLRQPLNSPTPPPEIGDADYISLLFRYRQAHPEGDDIKWAEADAASKAVSGATGKICRVFISESRDHPKAPIESFPAVGYGFEDGQQFPVFPKKKDAKKYAAKCAVDWLIAQSLMPNNLIDVTFPRGYKRPTEGSDGALDPSPKRTTTGTLLDVADYDNETLPATQRVDALCPQLGIRPPSYLTRKSDPNSDQYWDGHPSFGHDIDEVPGLEGLGRVTRVVGQKRARQKMAELVLEHLLSVYRERQSQLESFSAPSEAV